MDILEDYAKLKTWMLKSVEPGSGASIAVGVFTMFPD